MTRPLAALLLVLLPCAPVAADPVSFNRDVRPILSDACFSCHGPDQAKRKADLDLTTAAGGQHAVGEILTRITSADAAERMPPPKAGPALTPRQAAVLRD